MTTKLERKNRDGTASKNSETFGRKVLLLILDKIVFGLMLAIVGYYFSQKLQDSRTITDYQKTIFEKRFEAYAKMLHLAKTLSDDAAIYYGYNKDIEGMNKKFYWRARFDKVRSVMTGGSRSTWVSDSDILHSLETINATRNEYKIYLSDAAYNAIDNYLTIMMKDFEYSFNKFKNGEQLEDSFLNEALERSQIEFKKLEAFLLESVRIQELILG